MKGFEIKINNEEPIYANVEYGSVSVAIDIIPDEHEAYLSIAGTDVGAFVKWAYRSIKKGDRIKVKVSDIKEISHVLSTKEINRKELEERYLELKKELEEKSII